MATVTRVNFALDAGSTARRMRDAREIRHLQSDIRAFGGTVSQRAAYFAQNNCHAAAAISALEANIIGPGIRPLSRHRAKATRERLHELWSRWVDVADVTGRADFYGLQSLVVRQMVVDGEAFVRLVVGADGYPRCQVLHSDQVPRDYPLPNSDGIEYDDFGAPVAYYVRRRRAYDWAGAADEIVKIPASSMLHVFAAAETGQRRGLSWFAPVLLKLHELDRMDDAALVSAKVRNLIAGAITAPESEAAIRDAADEWEPGALVPLNPGEGIEWFEPKESDTYQSFTAGHLRAIAAGLGIPYEVITGDLSQVNYSSIRAGMVEFSKKLQKWQHNVIVWQLCRPIWRIFVNAAMLRGEIPVSKSAEAADRVEWQPPKIPWVDPLKDVQASVAAINAGLTSRSAVITELGYDPEVVDAEIAADAERARDLGISFDCPQAPGLPGADMARSEEQQ